MFFPTLAQVQKGGSIRTNGPSPMGEAFLGEGVGVSGVPIQPWPAACPSNELRWKVECRKAVGGVRRSPLRSSA